MRIYKGFQYSSLLDGDGKNMSVRWNRSGIRCYFTSASIRFSGHIAASAVMRHESWNMTHKRVCEHSVSYNNRNIYIPSVTMVMMVMNRGGTINMAEN
jgi:hypothetical protein